MMDDSSSTTHRRGFLGKVAAASLALGIGGMLPDRLDAAAQAVSPELEKWPDAHGKHRQVYDAVTWNNAFSLIWTMIFLDTNKQSSNLADSDLSAVVVMRHEAIPLAFTDPIWKKYKLGEAFKINDPATKAPAERNPYYHAKEGELMFPGMSIDMLMQRGVMFGCCNIALTITSGQRAEAIGVDKAAAKQEWTAGLIPGFTLLPSGVWGVNRAQEHGCSYCYAS